MPGITAAPNESTIYGEVTELNWSGSEEDKVTLKIRVSEYQSVFGPAFLEKDQLINGFFYTADLDLHVGERIFARVEYLGGSAKGIFQILEHKRLTSDN